MTTPKLQKPAILRDQNWTFYSEQLQEPQ